MRFFTILILMGLLSPCAGTAQSAREDGSQKPSPRSAGTPASQGIETEEIKIPESMQAPPRSMANQPGYMEPAQTRELLTKIWQAESRVKDLLSQVHPETLKMSPAALAVFNSNLAILRRNLAELERSRQGFAGRVDSEYLGFETYAGIGEILPPLDKLTEMVSRSNNFSLEGDFNQAWNEMLTMQHLLKPYLSFLLRNHDRIFVIMESNFYACQNELNYAMHNANGRAKPIRNVLPQFKGRRHQVKKTETGNSQNAKH